jgi:8-amino-7-oxononanoate synthase
MDGDCPNLEELVRISDEAPLSFSSWWSTCFGCFWFKVKDSFKCLVKTYFARILTFENALGCQGAAILGSLDWGIV